MPALDNSKLCVFEAAQLQEEHEADQAGGALGVQVPTWQVSDHMSSRRTWILYEDSNRSLNMIPIQNPTSILNRALLFESLTVAHILMIPHLESPNVSYAGVWILGAIPTNKGGVRRLALKLKFPLKQNGVGS